MENYIIKLRDSFKRFDRKFEGQISFFFGNWGKTKFMVAMSKKAQYLGLERLWEKGARAFWYFVLFYLVRDVILYIIIPIFITKFASN